MSIYDLNGYFHQKYQFIDWGHAYAILKNDFPQQLEDILQVLAGFELRKSNILARGGGKTKIAGYIDDQLYAKGWNEKQFETSVIIDGQVLNTPTHKVDCVKGRVALDIEWNNKTEFYDRDLNNFRLLHSLRAISVGVLIVRTSELQTAVFNPLGVGDKYGASTTHLDKLIPKIHGGGAGGCPLLVIGIKPASYVEDC